jgi:hypothetical protein
LPAELAVADRPPTSDGDVIGGTDGRHPEDEVTVAARFESSSDAAAAMAAAGRAGVDGEAMSYDAPSKIAPTDATDASAGVADSEGVTSVVGRRVLIGFPIGALLGAAGAAAVASLAGVDDGAVLSAAAFGGAVLVGAIGALIATFAAFGTGQAYGDAMAAPEDAGGVVSVTVPRSQVGSVQERLAGAGGDVERSVDESVRSQADPARADGAPSALVVHRTPAAESAVADQATGARQAQENIANESPA